MKQMVLFIWIASTCFLGLADEINDQFNPDSLTLAMTVKEKIELIVGYKNFNIKGLERLGIPQVKMADGPMGVKGNGKATAFPASICMAATWNSGLIKKMSQAIAVEAKSKGIGILLAPGINVYRVPHCGRNFEYYGEDPFLISQMAVSFIEGVQSQKVMATVKHFVANNQDYDRHRVSSNIDERTLHEIYFPAFKAAVQTAKVGAVMTSYNPLNRIHTSESPYLIREILKDSWGFGGIVMSDWISVYSTNSFFAGLDLEMPRAQFMSQENILMIIEKDPAAIKILNDKVKRILRTCHRLGLYQRKSILNKVDWRKHRQLAKQVAGEGFVLLKNDGNILPLKNENIKRIMVIGPNANYTPHSGGGAAMVEAYRMNSFFEGIKRNAPKNIEIHFQPIEGLYHSYSSINKRKFKEKLNRLRNYDAVILCVGFNPETEGEAFDRPFGLPKIQEWLIQQVCTTNSKIIVTLNAGGGISMPWLDNVQVLLHTWYPGEEGGNALGEIIFGKINPSGKLPISIEKHWRDNAAFSNYDDSFAVPGAKPFYTLYGKSHQITDLNYEEGIFLGYRHHDIKKIEPQFPFGFGLSYTTFKLSDLSVNRKILRGKTTIQATLKIQNTGNDYGSEVVQLYIHDVKSRLPRPLKELKAFKKVHLEPGQQAIIKFNINRKMLSYYNPLKHGWVCENGDFEICIGNAVNNIQLKQKISYSETPR